MEDRRILSPKLILGGALLGAFLLVVMPVFAYDQNNTHPALTDEIVDFYNASFSDKKLTEEEKQWLKKGSVDEDTGERPLFHFYDPVYNRGIFANLTSKDWALKDKAQANYYNKQLAGFPSLLLEDSNSDFSYMRALDDYAKGDKKRALIAFGHVLHLLEDAGVPDHTRNDPHPPVLDLGSPYEHEMAKWSPQNFKIVPKLIIQREKPVRFSDMESYFDRIANYSNNNFFSKDTISNQKYGSPNINKTKILFKDDEERLFLVGSDKNGQEFPLAFIDIVVIEGRKKIIDITLIKPKIGSHILDGYWERLSKEVVINGAGALRLFLEEAEEARQDYLVNGPRKNKGFFAQLLSVFGVGTNSQLATPDVLRTSGVGTVTKLSTVPTYDVGSSRGGDSGDTTGDTRASPSLSPLVSPVVSPKSLVSPSVSPSPTSTPISDTRCPQDVRCQQLKKTGRVVVNEIAWAGTEALATDEWLELYNAENEPIDISNWRLVSDDESPNIIFSEGTIIPANGYFLIERTNDNTIKDITADLAVSFGQGGLSNAGEVLKLIDLFGAVVDNVGKTGEVWLAGSSDGKYSMERIVPDPDLAGDNQSNWKNFSGAPLNHDANNNFINGTPKASNSTAVAMTGITSGGGSGGSSVSPTPSPLGESPLLKVTINEIAWMGTATSSTDEWMELYNTTNQTVDLTGWTLKSLTGASPDPQITLSGAVSPFGFYLLERTDDTTISDILADKIYTGALSDAGETLELRDASSVLQDKVSGNSGWHAGNKATDSSMERINPKISGDNSTNWSTNTGITRNGKDAADNLINGTPKTKNSGYVILKPSSVTDLAINPSFPTVTLTWSAPEDPDTFTADLNYDIRYSTLNFLDDNTWNTAIRIASSSLPAVKEKGASQGASFDITQYGQKVYLALKTKHKSDSADVSNISNIVSHEIVPAIASTSWAMLGKDQYHTSLTSITGPDIGATISWEYDLGSGYAISQPVVAADGDVYFGVAKSSDNRKLVKLNKNGVKQWEYVTNVSISMPAVLSDETIYFGRIGAGGVLPFTALNPDGSKKWDYDEASKVEHVVVSSKGEPYFTFRSGSQEKLLVLNTDGSVKATITSLGLGGFSPVILDNGTIITAKYISGNQFFTAYSSTSMQLWEVSYGGANGNVPSNPSYDQSVDKIYSAAGLKLFKIPSDGSTIEPYDVAPWDFSAATMVAISSNTLFVGFNNLTNPASGSKLFSVKKSDLTANWSFSTDSKINQQLAVDKENNVYFSTKNGKLYRVNSVGVGALLVNSGSNSDISPVLTEHGLVWGYGNRIVLIGK